MTDSRRTLRSLPHRGRALNDREEGMLKRYCAALVREALGRTSLELGQQMLPLGLQLAVGHFEPDGRRMPHRDSGGVEMIPTSPGLLFEPAQVQGDGVERAVACPEPIELRMVTVALGAPAQHRLRQQRLTPAGDQRLPIE